MQTINKEQLTSNLTKKLFNIAYNYEIGLFENKDILKEFLFILYDIKAINTEELDSLYIRIDKTPNKQIIKELKKLY